MKNFDSSNTVNFFTGRAPDAFAVRLRVGHIAGVDQIEKQPTGNHHALVQYLLLKRRCGREMIELSAAPESLQRQHA